jgi:hypothetical protein
MFKSRASLGAAAIFYAGLHGYGDANELPAQFKNVTLYIILAGTGCFHEGKTVSCEPARTIDTVIMLNSKIILKPVSDSVGKNEMAEDNIQRSVPSGDLYIVGETVDILHDENAGDYDMYYQSRLHPGADKMVQVVGLTHSARVTPLGVILTRDEKTNRFRTHDDLLEVERYQEIRINVANGACSCTPVAKRTFITETPPDRVQRNYYIDFKYSSTQCNVETRNP